MPNWKKLVQHGSDVTFNSITASAALISGSGPDRLIVIGSGSTQDTNIFQVYGNNGLLFSVDDTLSGSLFSVNDQSGLPIFDIFDNGTVNIGTFPNYALVISGSTMQGSGSFSGSFTGDGSGITNIQVSNLDVIGSDKQVFFNNGGSFGAASNLYWDEANDRLGIGTNAPSYKLVVDSPSADDGILLNSPNPSIWFKDDTNPNKNWRIYNQGADDGLSIISVNDDLTTGNTRMFFEHSTGNVGIGTTSPTNKLQVVGGTLGIANDQTGFNNNSMLQISRGSDPSYIQFISNNTQEQGILFGDPEDTVEGSVRYHHSGDYMYFQTNNSEQVRINSAGNVGIGTTSPTQKLHVDGNVRIEGGIYDSSNSIGTSGQVLKSTGTGIEWQTDDAGSNFYLTGSFFNTSNGELSLFVSGASNVTVDLDGRYLTSYTETQTLQDVTDLGNTTTNDIEVDGMYIGSFGTSSATVVGNRASDLSTNRDYQSAFGYLSGENNSGDRQSAFGYASGRFNSGEYQSAFGYASGVSNSGNNQSAFGYSAGRDNSGFGQSAFGYVAGQNNTGANQSAFGHYAGFNNTGSNQSAFGYEAGRDNSADNQSVFGYFAGRNNSGVYQSAFGYQAGQDNTANYQSAFGYWAGRDNSGDRQQAFGYFAGENNSGDRQSAFGFYAGQNNTANYQSAFGYLAGLNNLGNNQSAFGYLAGRNNTGSNSSFFGYDVGNGNSYDDVHLFGYILTASKDHQTSLGSSTTEELKIRDWEFEVSQSLTPTEDGYLLGYDNSTGKISFTNTFSGTAETASYVDWTNIDSIPSGINTGSAQDNEVLFWKNGGITGSQDLYWDEANDRLGIGTNSPSRRLYVVGSEWDNVTGGGVIFENSSNIGASLTLKPSNSGVTNGSNGWAVYAGAGSAAIGDGNLGFWAHGTNQARMVIQRGGNVGIGTTNPSEKLHIIGGTNTLAIIETQTNGGSSALRLDANPNYWEIKNYGPSANLGITRGASEFVTIDNTGNVGIGTTSPTAKLHIDAISEAEAIRITGDSARIRFANDTDSPRSYIEQIGQNFYLANEAAGDLYLQTSGLTRATIDDTGNVGIGTTSPSQKLHVDGNVRIEGGIYDSNNSIGSSGQILSSTGTGIDWVDGSSLTAGTASYYDETQTLQDVTDLGNATTNDIEVDGMYIGSYGTSSATIVGNGASDSSTNRSLQSAFGYEAGKSNSGINQSAFGYYAGRDNSGDRQQAFGVYAGQNNIGTDQSAFGYFAGQNNSADNQSAFGYWAGISNSGNAQSAFGYLAGRDNSGNNQSAFGYLAGRNNSGSNSSFFGYAVGNENTYDDVHLFGYILTASKDHQTSLGSSTTEELKIRDWEFEVSQSLGSGQDGYLLGYDNASGKIKFTNTFSGTADTASYVQVSNLDVIGSDKQVFFNDGGSFGAASNLYWDEANDRLGIGTSSPTDLLHILKNQDAPTQIRVENQSNTGNSRASIAVGTAGNAITMARYLSNYTTVPSWASSGGILTDSGLTNGFFFRTSAGPIRFQPAGSVDRVVFDTSGNVGIGTTSPDQPFHVESTETFIAKFKTTGNSNQVVSMEAPVGYNTNLYFYEGSTAKAGIRWDGSNDKFLFKVNNTSTDALTILDGGNVGIGTSNPEYKLDIIGDSPVLRIADDNVSNSPSASAIWMGENGASEVRGAGIIYNGQSNALNIVTSDNGALANSDPYNAIERVTVLETNGNVGIGTTSPSQKLHVNGNVRIEGGIYDSSNLIGTSGQILSSTGTGIDWVDGSSLTAGTASYVDWVDIDNIPSGIVSSSAQDNEVLFWKNGGITGSQDLYWDGSQLGIGTTSPSTLLEINSGNKVTTDEVLRFGKHSGYGTTRFYQSYDSDYFANGKNLRIGIEGTEGLILAAPNNASSVDLYIPNGNVGIGTTSPSTLLELELDDSTTISAGTFSQNALRIENTSQTNGSYSAIAFAVRNSNNNIGNASIAAYSTSTNSSAGLAFQTRNGGTFAERLRIEPDGDVGIGTTSPSAKLHIDDTFNVSGNFRLGDSSVYAGGWARAISTLYQGTSTGIVNFLRSGLLGNGDSLSYYWISMNTTTSSPWNNNALRIYPNNNIFFNGNVGIGTTSPSQKLHVDGNVRIEGGIYDSNNSIGSSGQILSSTGTGIDWIDGSSLTAGTASYYVETQTLQDVTDLGNTTTNDIEVDGMYIGSYGTSSATVVGNGASDSSTNRTQQSAFGADAGVGNSGVSQAAFGYQAGQSNIGNGQSAFGYLSGQGNTAEYQSAFGYRAGYSNTGNYQSAFGYYAGDQNSGSNSSFFGHGVGTNNTYDDVHLFGYILSASKDHQTSLGSSTTEELKIRDWEFEVSQSLGSGQDGYLLGYDNASGKIKFTNTFSGTADTASYVQVANLDVIGSDKQVFFNNGGSFGAASNLYWDETNDRLGIGTSSPTSKLHVDGNILIEDTFPRFYLKDTDNSAETEIQNTGGTLVLKASSTKDIRFVHGSTETMRILGGGNVGIGTTSPTTKLHVEGITRVTENGNTAFYGGDYVRVFDNQYYNFRNVGGSTIARINLNGNSYFNGGNVGIGTTNPTAKLQINNNYTINGSYGGSSLYISLVGGSSYDPQLTNTTDIPIMATVSSANTTGPDKVGLVLYNDDTTAGGFSPMLLFSKRESGGSPYKATMAGIYARSPLGTGNSNSWIDGELIFATAGAATNGLEQRAVIDKSGNFGIGTTSPTQKLHVDGNVRIEGGIYDSNNSIGTSGQILSSTGTGIDWIDPNSISAGTASYVDWVDIDNIPSGIVSSSAQVNHDSTTGFVANEHINHASVSINAGAGLTGGGNITTSRTLNIGAGAGIQVNSNDIELDIFNLTATTLSNGADAIPIYDASLGGERKILLSDVDLSSLNNDSGFITGNQTITLSGDVAGSGTTAITTTIQSSAVEASMLNNNVISGRTALTSGLLSTDELMVSDGGTLKRMDVSVLESYMQSNLTFLTSETQTLQDVTDLGNATTNDIEVDGLYIGSYGTSSATVVGNGASDSSTNRTQQSAFGTDAGVGNSGVSQAAFGYQAGQSNIGNGQSAFGYLTGQGNTAEYQSAFGYRAGYSNTGNYQSAFGYYAGDQNSGSNSSFFGHGVGINNAYDDVHLFGYILTASKDHQTSLGSSTTEELKIRDWEFEVSQSLGASQDGYLLGYDNASGKIKFEAPPAENPQYDYDGATSTTLGSYDDGSAKFINFQQAASSISAGKIYAFASNGSWVEASNDNGNTVKGLLAVGTTDTDGNDMLQMGVVTVSGSMSTVGLPVYLGTSGTATTTAPASGSFARIIGHVIQLQQEDRAKIFFNPSQDWIEVT